MAVVMNLFNVRREEANYLMAFKEFMLKRVPDDCAPEEAQRMYQVSGWHLRVHVGFISFCFSDRFN